MTYVDYTKEEIRKNVVLKKVKTEKYKDFNLYFSFIGDIDLRHKAALQIVKEIVGIVSENYPDKRSMSGRRNLLYGASVDSTIHSLAYHTCLSFHYNFVDIRYLDDVFLSDYLSFIEDTLFHPLINEANFNEIRKLLIESTIRKLDKPSSYSRNRVYEILAEEDDRFKSLEADLTSVYKTLTLVEVKKAFSDMLENGALEIVLIGDISEELEEGIRMLPFKERDVSFKEIPEVKLSSFKTVEEEKKVSQSCLINAYKLECHDCFNGKQYHSLLLGEAILGLLPCSLLFKEVREKKSLCYTISTSDMKKDGLVFVFTLFSYKNKDKITKEIENQLNRLKNGEYDDDTFNMSKKLFMDSLIQSTDDADGLYNCIHNRGFFSNESFEELLKGIESLTKKDISDLFMNYAPVLTYVLKGNEEKH